jgi:N-acetyl-1-D-myo-inositol-2-amino-2-deoxy-alpha-D-glucopyranoside deacetylase
MPAPLQDLTESSLLAVFAHPDDESLACGGLLALCAERGVRVSLVCLTHGEHGPGSGDGDLGETRARELEDAARILGIRDVVLLDHEDGMLPWIDSARLEADILDAVSRFRPDVVVTFDEDGLYWHPDHVAVHVRTTAVLARLGASAPALRYVSIPIGTMRAVIEAVTSHAAVGNAAPERAPERILGVEDPDAFGSMAPAPTLVVQAGRLAGRKLAALRCHRSQIEGSALERIDERDAARLLGTEHYRSAPVGAPGDSFLEGLGQPFTAVGT